MRDICKRFVAAAHGRPDSIQSTTRALLAFPLAPALIDVLEAFVELQEARHQADYDLTTPWNRMRAANHVETARTAFASWQTIRNDPNTRVLVAAILLQGQWGR
jgi:hypothetical protein